MGEYLSGDIPAPAKWLLPGLKEGADFLQKHFEEVYDCPYELDEVEEDWVKMADCLELLFFCFEEYKLGNRKMRLLFDKVCEVWIENKFNQDEQSHRVFQDLRTSMLRWDDK